MSEGTKRNISVVKDADALYEKDYEKMVDIFKKHDIKYVLLNGGNGTMDACGHIYEVCKDQDIKVVGIPKTIDNDIAMTDHSPGYGSAARFSRPRA